jgi:hypothetical protein
VRRCQFYTARHHNHGQQSTFYLRKAQYFVNTQRLGSRGQTRDIQCCPRLRGTSCERVEVWARSVVTNVSPVSVLLCVLALIAHTAAVFMPLYYGILVAFVGYEQSREAGIHHCCEDSVCLVKELVGLNNSSTSRRETWERDKGTAKMRGSWALRP